jgi:hypothetical protein
VFDLVLDKVIKNAKCVVIRVCLISHWYVKLKKCVKCGGGMCSNDKTESGTLMNMTLLLCYACVKTLETV